MNWKKLASLGVVAMMSLSILGCGSDSASNNSSGGDSSSISGSVTGSGSSALLPLAKDAADKFKELHPEVSITLNGGGSGTGLKLSNTYVLIPLAFKQRAEISLNSLDICLESYAITTDNTFMKRK